MLLLLLLAIIALHEQAAPDQPAPTPTQPTPSITTVKATTVRPDPKCGIAGCYNNGECRYVSASNSTTFCKCSSGWSGASCETCYGRTSLIARDDVNVIHDGHGNYTSNALSKCSWLIENETPETKMIELKLANFSTECGWDHLYIFDGTSALDSSTLGAYCGIIKQQHVLHGTSGHMFLHFYSDMAYNMSGFNIEYKLVDRDNETGLVDITTETDQHGNKWMKRPLPLDFGARAASSMTLVNDRIYVWGGYQFPSTSTPYDNRMWMFDGLKWANVTSTEDAGSADYIKLRYGGAMVGWDDNRIIVYGGVRYEPDYEVVDDVWEFNIETSKWRDITPKKIGTQSLSAAYLPLPNSGHSMVKVTFENGTSIIVSYGGYSPAYGYLSTVQEFIIESPIAYDDNDNEVNVRLPFTYGERPVGSYGHVALVDPKRPWLVYYYGGFKNSALSDALTVYNAQERRFSRMVNSKMGSVNARWFHSGVVWRQDYLVFIAGNTHTDTVFSTGSLCFSNDIVIYSLKCNKWQLVTIPAWYPRYGASALLYQDQFFIVGGFNGALIDDYVQLELSPEMLRGYMDGSDADSCVIAPEGIAACDETYSKKTFLGTDKCTDCRHNNYWTLNDAYRTCAYCADQCSATCPRASDQQQQCDPLPERQFACNYPSPKCASCVLSGCEYYVYTNKSEKRTRSICSTSLAEPDQRNITVAKMNSTQECAASQLAFECGTYRSCELCTQKHNCMWCGILGTCVSNEAHVTSFPFGQCHEWFQKQHCYKTTCQGHLTCRSCQNDPRCGWCDDGSGRGSGECMEGQLEDAKDATCQAQNWFWVDCPQCNCSGHSQCDDEGNCLKCENFTSGTNCERCMDDYHGIALNNGICTKCECGVHGKSCDHTTGKCSCTTKGITGNKCDQCDKDGYKGNAINSTCYYDIKTDFQYSFRMKPDIDKDVTKLNCIVVPTKAEPGIKVKVIIEKTQDASDSSKSLLDSGNNTLSVSVNTTLPSNGTAEEQLVSVTNTTNFEHSISIKKYKFGPDTNRTILIYIYDFQTPLKIKVTVTQHVPMSLLTFFLVFFACFLSLLLIAVIVWKLKTMWDVQLQRRAVMNEMRQMAARPFASVEMQLDGIGVETEGDTAQLVTPACYEIIEDKSAAVATVLMLLPRHRSGAPSIGDSAVCFGSVMVNYNEKYEADFLLDGNEGDNPDEWGYNNVPPQPDSAT